MTRQRVAWNAAPVRRAAGVEQWARRMGIGVHPALMLEGRGSANAVPAMYAQHAISAETALVVVPATSLVTATNLARFGVPSRCDFREAHAVKEKANGAEQGPVAALLQCASRSAWVELVWRLALDLSNSKSRWWGWHGLLPSANAVNAFLDDQAKAAFMSSSVAYAYPSWVRLVRMINDDVDAAWQWMSSQSRVMMTPSFPAFRRASWICIRRARWLPHVLDSSLPPQLGIAPIADLAPAAPTAATAEATQQSGVAEFDVCEAWDETPSWYQQGGVDDAVFDSLPDHVLESDKRRLLLDQEVQEWEKASQRALATYWLTLTTVSDVSVASRVTALSTSYPESNDVVERVIVNYALTGEVVGAPSR